MIHICKITQDHFDPLSVNNLPHSKKDTVPTGFDLLYTAELKHVTLAPFFFLSETVVVVCFA